jgi:hypothetical protein
VWDHNLRYDFSYIETVNGIFFFRNNWWLTTNSPMCSNQLMEGIS